MSDIRHHITEGMLWDHHRGSLPPGLSLTVAVHLDLCPHCRANAAVLDAVGGVLLADIEGAEMSPDALDLAMARIERPKQAGGPVEGKSPAFLNDFERPESLKAASIRNRYWVAPGVWIAPIFLESAPKTSKTYLMRVKAGMTVPEHSHHGPEATLVLKGRFSDRYGDYGTGDIALCADDHCHSPAVVGEDCLCLVWQAAPIVPKTWLGRLLQPFAGI